MKRFWTVVPIQDDLGRYNVEVCGLCNDVIICFCFPYRLYLLSLYTNLKS